jgi:hypothetical protein
MALIDFNESFIQKLGTGLDARTKFVVKEFTRALEGEVVLHTPKKSGKARQNWNVNIGGPDTQVRPATAGQKDNSGVYDRMTASAPVFLTNHVPYIRRLENGYSKQAPQGMARAAEVKAYDRLEEICTKAQNEVPLIQ